MVYWRGLLVQSVVSKAVRAVITCSLAKRLDPRGAVPQMDPSDVVSTALMPCGGSDRYMPAIWSCDSSAVTSKVKTVLSHDLEF